MTDWNDSESPISKHFKVREALFLPTWGRKATVDDGLTDDAKEGILRIAGSMDWVREFINLPLYIHCWFRPEAYNKAVGGAEDSAHVARAYVMQGEVFKISAVDFHAILPSKGSVVASCNEIRSMLLPKIEQLGLRMEDRPDGSWVHLDNRAVLPGGIRYFKA